MLLYTAVNYAEATEHFQTHFAEAPEHLELLMELHDLSRHQAVRYAAALAAPTYAQKLAGKELKKPGQIAQALSGWHAVLQTDCEGAYRDLTHNPQGPQLSRERANATPELLTLQAIRRGVRDAMRLGYRSTPLDMQLPGLPWAIRTVGIRQWAAD